MDALIKTYTEWFQGESSIKSIDDWLEITTPNLDRHNDFLQIYVKMENGTYYLTDAGYIIEDLKSCGFRLDTAKRKRLLEEIINGFGIQLYQERELTATATKDNFALKQHSLLQAMLAVNDMFYLVSPGTERTFVEDVSTWLDQNGIRYVPNVKFAGASGLDHTFHFVVPKSKIRPERLLRAINNPNRNDMESFAFGWIDTQKTRSAGSIAYAVLNDEESKVSGSIEPAFRRYNIEPLRWSRRVDYVDALAA